MLFMSLILISIVCCLLAVSTSLMILLGTSSPETTTKRPTFLRFLNRICCFSSPGGFPRSKTGSQIGRSNSPSLTACSSGDISLYLIFNWSKADLSKSSSSILAKKKALMAVVKSIAVPRLLIMLSNISIIFDPMSRIFSTSL